MRIMQIIGFSTKTSLFDVLVIDQKHTNKPFMFWFYPNGVVVFRDRGGDNGNPFFENCKYQIFSEIVLWSNKTVNRV